MGMDCLLFVLTQPHGTQVLAGWLAKTLPWSRQSSIASRGEADVGPDTPESPEPTWTLTRNLLSASQASLQLCK